MERSRSARATTPSPPRRTLWVANLNVTANAAFDLYGSSTAQATLEFGSGAGAAGIVNCELSLSGDALAEYASGQFATIERTLSLNGSHAFVADASDTNSNSMLEGLHTILKGGRLELENGASVTTSGALTNRGAIALDGSSGDGGSFLNIKGTLTNSGTVQIGASDNTLSADSTIQAGSLANFNGSAYGTIDLFGSSTAQATLDVGSAAGFGAAGVLYGDVNLSGDALVEFRSGQITTIAADSALSLTGSHAFVMAASGTNLRNALAGLNSVAGELDLANGATVGTSVRGGGLANSGMITLDGASGDGGSLLHVNEILTNSGIVSIGSSTGTQSANGTLITIGIVNTGTINLFGDQKANVNATVHVAGGFTNDGSVNLSKDFERLANGIGGTGDFSLSKHSTLEFGSSVSSGETVTFNRVDKLILGQPSSFDGVIDDFTTAGDTVVLKGFAESATSLLYTQTSADSCSLTLTNATHSAVIHFAGAAYTQSDFSLVPWYGGAGSAIKFV